MDGSPIILHCAGRDVRLITLKQDRGEFLLRVAGVFIHNNKILLMRTSKGTAWVLPGGRLEINEKSSDAVIREFKEELGFSMKVNRPLWVIENFNAYGNRNLHEFGIYYRLEAERLDEIRWEPGEFHGIEDAVKLTFKWFDLDELENIKLYPLCVKELLKETGQGMKHVVNDDLNPMRP